MTKSKKAKEDAIKAKKAVSPATPPAEPEQVHGDAGLDEGLPSQAELNDDGLGAPENQPPAEPCNSEDSDGEVDEQDKPQPPRKPPYVVVELSIPLATENLPNQRLHLDAQLAQGEQREALAMLQGAMTASGERMGKTGRAVEGAPDAVRRLLEMIHAAAVDAGMFSDETQN